MFEACSAPDGPQGGTTYYWQLGANTFQFGQCSDEPRFRDSVKLTATEGKFLIYRVAEDLKTASSLDCKSLDQSSCTPVADETWTVAGKELALVRERKDPIGMSGCSQLQTVTWTALDRGHTVDVEINNVLTLVDNQAACDAIDADLKARSPNGMGFAGCVLTARLSGERVLPR
jgi:hypothetical protein